MKTFQLMLALNLGLLVSGTCGCWVPFPSQTETWDYGKFRVTFGGLANGVFGASEDAHDCVYIRDQLTMEVKRMDELVEADFAKGSLPPGAEKSHLYQSRGGTFIFTDGKCTTVLCAPSKGGYAFARSKGGPFYEKSSDQEDVRKAFGEPKSKSRRTVPAL